MPLSSLTDALKRTVTDVTERQEQGGVDIIGIPTGLYHVDRILSGLRNDAVYIIGGRAGLGKTSLGMTIATNIAKIDKHVLFLSLEMSADLLALRTISGLTGIDADLIERGRLTDEELKRVQAVTPELGKLKFGIMDDSTDSEAFLEYAIEYKNKVGLDVVFIDYLSLLRDPQTFGDTERVGRISRNIRTLARECNIPVVALVQLNREVEKRADHKPILSDIRSSGDIEQDAFAVLFAYRPHYYAMMHEGESEVALEKDAEIIIAKNRQGKTGATRALFYPTQMRWEQHAPDLKQPPRTLVERVKEKR